jgi:ParB family chromosome partitioning protein
MAEKKAPAAKKPRARRKKVEPKSSGLSPGEVTAGSAPREVATLAAAVAEDGGQVLAQYREPVGGTWLLLAALPIDKVEPTPFQRDLSEAHAKRLTDVIERIGRFLDPIIAVREGEQYFTPNGRHRLAALSKLGARTVVALVVPDAAIAYRILALNTEKAHNLRERALEVARMYRDLAARQASRREDEFTLEFEEASLATLGLCYESRPRFSGGAYHPLVRRIDTLTDMPLGKALAMRESRAKEVLALDDRVAKLIEQLRERGLQSPYLRNFVIARVNPLRFRRGATLEWDEAMEKTVAAAAKFDAGKIRPQDLASAGGAPDEAGG